MKLKKVSFRLFETKIGEKLEMIWTCDLSYFDNSKKETDTEAEQQIEISFQTNFFFQYLIWDIVISI